ncbi:MAG: O-antigen polysaccharide polymerase Wzy [Erysipelotrichaceae bacterium]|nr:O-antigen polysaccharide polymerase Wzy [Erysipelotrichaceae bacterium]
MRLMIKSKWVIMILLDLFCLLPAIFNQNLTKITLILIVWSNGIIYALDDLNNRSSMFAFLISFFTFLIGRQAMERFGIYEVEHVFSEELNLLAENMLLVSLIVLLTFYVIFNSFSRKKTVNTMRSDYSSMNYRMIREVSRFFFMVTFLFSLVTLLDIVIYVLRNGYLSYYTSYTSSVPYVIKKIGEMSPICYWVFLATMPEKKETDRVTLFYIFYLFSTLGTGKRFPFVAGLLTILVYYLSRNRINNEKKEVWFGRRHMRFMVMAVPLMMLLLFMIGQVRTTIGGGTYNIGSFVTDFIYDQGSSINFIKRMVKFNDYLPRNKMYLFGSTYEKLTGNVIFRLMGATQYKGNTAMHALQGYSLQHALSYITMGSYYLAGHGIGSCYIAEAYHDYGYIGIILVNIVYAFIFSKVFDFRKKNVWSCSITLIILYSLLLAPRGSADGFIIDIIDLTTWGTIVVIWFTSKFLLSHSGIRLIRRKTAAGEAI